MDEEEVNVEYLGLNLLLNDVQRTEPPPLLAEWPFFTVISSTDSDLLLFVGISVRISSEEPSKNNTTKS